MSTSTQQSALAGPPGSFPLSSTYSCAAGFYCPNVKSSNPASVPRYYQPSTECTEDRLGSRDCQAQGLYEPVVCTKGFYCPDAYTNLTCPAGNYCPTGTSNPIACPLFSTCPEGSKTYIYWGPMLLMIIIDLLLAVGAAVMYYRSKEPSAALKKRASVKEGGAPAKGAAKTDDAEGDVNVLTEAFRKGLEGKSLRMDFGFEDLSLKLPTGKSVLEGVTGNITAGRMTAVMGPSGAGKTTFMNVLMGKVARTGGRLFVSGKEVSMSEYKKCIGYVPQEDIMLRELTVRENIEYSARIRLPASWTDAEISTHVDKILVALNLAHVQHTPIGDENTRGISGGQRKRVNIAMELAAVPLALFLDEPTSGLDSTAALSVARILNSISGLGVTVVAVVHQPRKEIFTVFQDLLLIAPGGKTVYHGPTKHVQKYFERMGFFFEPSGNTADILMDILSGSGVFNSDVENPLKPALAAMVRNWHLKRGTSKKLAKRASMQDLLAPSKTADELLSVLQMFDKAEPSSPASMLSVASTVGEDKAVSDQVNNFHEVIVGLCQRRGAPNWKQFFLAHNRSVVQQYRSTTSLWIELFVALSAGVLMGIAAVGANDELFRGVYKAPYTILSPTPRMWSIPLYAMLIGLSIALASGPAGVRVFSEERVVYFREAAAGHSRSAYYAGKTIAAVYRIALGSLHFAAMYYIIAWPVTPFGMFFYVTLLTFWGVYGLGAITSMIVARTNAALLSAIVCLFHGVFCGFGPTLQKVADWKMLWIWNISFNRWGSEVIFSQEATFNQVYDQAIATKAFEYGLNREAMCLGIMFALGVAHRIIGFGLMVATNRDKQK